MSNLKLFTLSTLASLGIMSLVNYWKQPAPYDPGELPQLVELADDVWLTAQLHPRNIRALGEGMYKTVIAIRPDGEAADQPSSTEIGRATKAEGMTFHYIPVPHEGIPDTAVEALTAALNAPDAKPAVLYCRTGRRAVRLFALTEASRADGPCQKDITEMLVKGGASAEDVSDQIKQRMAARPAAPAK